MYRYYGKGEAVSDFAVIVPSRNSTNVDACVSAIRAMGEMAEIIIVDDGLDVRRDDCRYIDGQKPFVFPRAINMGIRAAGKHHGYVCCNDDALLESPLGFTKLHEASVKNPTIGLIGAVTNLTGQPLQQPRGIGLRVVPHFAFVCVYIPQATLDNIQWPDQRYCLDYGVDDRDMCEAVNRAGSQCAVLDHCYLDHGKLKSSYRGNPEAPRSFAQNHKLLIEKWGAISA